MNPMQLAHSKAIITGAASGIGRAIAVSLAKRKCNLIITDINTQGLDETAQLVKSHDIPVSCHKLDVADKQAINDFAKKVQAEHEHIDLLINNAGVAQWGTFEQVSEADFDWLFDINFHGVVHMTRAFLPMLKQSSDARIVNLSSVFGIIAPAGQVAYSASKFAVRGFSEALRNELVDTSVGVTVVHPGGIATKIAENARPAEALSAATVEEEVKTSRQLLVLPPEKAGEIIVNGIQNRKKRVLVGNDAKVISIIARLFPDSYMKVMDRLF